MLAPAAALAGTPLGRRVLLGAVGACVLLGGVFVVLVGSMAGALDAGGGDGGGGASRPSTVALADIPGDYLALYQQAGRAYRIDWAVVAAIGKIETNHGRGTAPGIRSGVNFALCCAGPMQFSVIGAGGGTWGAYGVDGNRDGAKSVYDPADAIPAAARYLRASGAPGDMHAAIFAYNHAEWYVTDVQQQAARYRGALQDAVAVGDATVRSVIQAAVALDAMRVPYNYRGGHVTPATPGPGDDGAFPGLDCSSAVSWVLQHAGISTPTLASTAFMSWGDPGPGRFVTLYANPSHIFMSILVDGQLHYFGTSGFGHPRAGTGAAWFTRPVSRGYIAGFTQRHPPGM